MIKLTSITPTIPVTNLARSKDFYGTKLGLKESTIKAEPDSVMYEAGDGTYLYIYQRGASKADHTLASFKVDNLEQAINDLSKNGVEFEHYDLPGLKTDEKGIALVGTAKVAWFKDPDNNILGLAQM